MRAAAFAADIEFPRHGLQAIHAHDTKRIDSCSKPIKSAYA